MLSLVINSINIRLEVPKKKKLEGEWLNVPFNHQIWLRWSDMYGRYAWKEKLIMMTPKQSKWLRNVSGCLWYFKKLSREFNLIYFWNLNSFPVFLGRWTKWVTIGTVPLSLSLSPSSGCKVGWTYIIESTMVMPYHQDKTPVVCIT